MKNEKNYVLKKFYEVNSLIWILKNKYKKSFKNIIAIKK